MKSIFSMFRCIKQTREASQKAEDKAEHEAQEMRKAIDTNRRAVESVTRQFEMPRREQKFSRV